MRAPSQIEAEEPLKTWEWGFSWLSAGVGQGGDITSNDEVTNPRKETPPMETKAALGAAGGIALTVAGGVSALLLTMGPSGAAPAAVETDGDAVVTQYVDEAGNPIDAPAMADADVSPEVVVIGADGQPIDGSLQADSMEDSEMEAADDADEYPEGEEPEEDEYPEDEEGEYPEGEEPEENEEDDDEDEEEDEDD